MHPRELPAQGEPHLVDEFSLLRAVIDAVPDPIFCKDRAGRYLLTNRAHSARLQVPHGACLGKTVFELGIEPDLAQRYHEDDMKVLETGEAILNREEPFVWADGSRGWYLTSKYPLLDEHGEVVGLVGLARNITERRHAERELRDERRMLRTIIDAVADPILFKDHVGHYLLVNAAYEKLFGWREGEVIGKSDADIVRLRGYDEGFTEGYVADDRRVLQTGEPIINREEPFDRLDGTTGWFLTSKFPLRDTEGKIIGLVGIARDITVLRRAAEELAQTRQRLVDHVENSPLAVIEWQPNFRVDRWSGQAEAMFGWTRVEVVGRHFGDWPFIHPEDAKAVGEIAAHLLEGRALRNVSNHRNLTKDGRTLHCVWHNSALRDAEGRVVSLLSLVEDVTERIDAERAARESQRYYQTLVEATDTGYVVIDANGCVLEANAEYIRLTGHRRLEEIRGRCVVEWTAPHDLERNAREVDLCIRTGATRHLEIDYVCPDGRIIPVEINARLLETSEGRQIIALCRDISSRRAIEAEKRQIERKLQESQKLESLGVLAGGIAHDFNNLLTGVLVNASLAAMDLPPNSPVLGYIEQIEIASTRAADLCKQMLAYSGKGRFVVRRHDLNALIAETTNLLRVSISKSATLTLDLVRGLPPVLADATQLRQVVMNLVINASESLGAGGGAIRVSTGLVRAGRETFTAAHLSPDLPEGDYVFLEVTDNGCGMLPDVRERIFDPFFTTKFTGRGLGLAAVLGIVRGHHGALQVESQPERGTTFRVLLPAADGAVEAEAAPDDSEATWRGQGTVLLIDDEETVRTTAAQMLRTMGFEVQTAVDGIEGIELFRAAPERFALVLLDLTMPQLDGEGAFKVLRELRADVRVVLMSGYNEGQVAARFGADGPAAFVQKPFHLPSLREKLRALLG